MSSDRYMNSANIPSTDFVGEIKIKDQTIPCAVLYPDSENPKRVLVQREIVGLLTGNKKGGFDRYLKPKNLQPFIPEKFKEKPLSESTLSFKLKGRAAQGFEATDLIDICEIYINANNEGVLLKTQRHLAIAAHAIISAFAKVGIIAVIDEATGYQKLRDSIALQKILDKYLLIDYAKWARRFPPEFYEEMFRLRDWQYSPLKVKRPSVIGRFTNDIIYERLAPRLLDELRKKNPPDEKGRRKVKHHQFLTEDLGHPKLQEHLSNVITLMRASSNWSNFYRLLQRALPKYGNTIPLALDDE